jgi:hypothetical protein
MPEDETITSFADRLVDIAEQNILQQGGSRITEGFTARYQIPVQQPHNIRPIPNLEEEGIRLRNEYGNNISEILISKTTSNREKAKAAYLAIVLDIVESIYEKNPEVWQGALNALETFPQLAQVLYHHSPVPLAEPIKERALNSGLKLPERQEEEWLWQRTLESAGNVNK